MDSHLFGTSDEGEGDAITKKKTCLDPAAKSHALDSLRTSR